MKTVGIRGEDRIYNIKLYSINLIFYWIFFVITGYIIFILISDYQGEGVHGEDAKDFEILNKEQLKIFYIMFQLLILVKMI